MSRTQISVLCDLKKMPMVYINIVSKHPIGMALICSKLKIKYYVGEAALKWRKRDLIFLQVHVLISYLQVPVHV